VINFKEINERTIPHIEAILSQLKIETRLTGKELQFINPLRNDSDFGSASINVESGMWADFAEADDQKAKGGDLISLVAYLTGTSQSLAAEKLQSFLSEPTHQAVEALGVVEVIESVNFQTHTVLNDVKYERVYPVPDGTPFLPRDFGDRLGEPSEIYPYRNEQGTLLGYMLRFDLFTGKTIRPATLWKDQAGKYKWIIIGFPTPRPLYNLHLLAQKPDVPVLIVEGEKSANAASQLFPDHVVVTTMHGSKSPEKSDLTPLQGRSVVIWPDYDGPGQRYEETMIKLLRSQDDKASVSIMLPITDSAIYELNTRKPILESGFIPSEGWDAADALAEGWTSDHIKLLPADTFVEFKTTQNCTVGNAIAVEDDDIEMPNSIVQFLAKFHPHGLNYISGSFYGYKTGYWPNLDTAAIITKQIARYYGAGAEKNIIDNHMVLLKAFMAQLAENIAPDLSLICLSNGTLDTSTGTLIDHSPSHNLRTKTEISWDPEALCPRWLTFLDQIFANDADKTEKVAFLKAWFGYCLVPDNSQQKFVWMVGGGGNGKSLLLSILTRLAGTDNVSHAYMERLKEKVVRAELEGKLINISPEMSADATISDGYLKSIVAGDIIEAERKFKPSFSFKPFVRLIAATNHLPRLLDLSDGFFRRAIVLSFNRQFLGADCDPDLENKLVSELPGIFTWAVEGLKELRAAGQFVIPPSSLAALAQYKAEADTVGMFAKECLVKVDTGGLKPSVIYAGYRDWCYKSGFSPMNAIRFGRRLSELKYSKRKGGGKEYWLVHPVEGNDFVSGINMVYSENIVPIKSPAVPSEIANKYKL
jgi:putative DNA primase/helicase